MIQANFTFALPTLVETVELTDYQKRRVVQNQVFDLLQQEDLRILNRTRYIAYLKLHKKRHSPEMIKAWAKDPNKVTKKIKAIDKRSYGFMTVHLKHYTDFEYLKSVCQDKLNRSESPTLYVLSLNKW